MTSIAGNGVYGPNLRVLRGCLKDYGIDEKDITPIVMIVDLSEGAIKDATEKDIQSITDSISLNCHLDKKVIEEFVSDIIYSLEYGNGVANDNIKITKDPVESVIKSHTHNTDDGSAKKNNECFLCHNKKVQNRYGDDFVCSSCMKLLEKNLPDDYTYDDVLAKIESLKKESLPEEEQDPFELSSADIIENTESGSKTTASDSSDNNVAKEGNKEKQSKKKKTTDKGNCCICGKLTNDYKIKDDYCCSECLPDKCRDNPGKFTIDDLYKIIDNDENIIAEPEESKHIERIVSGKCRDNIEWKYDNFTGHLTINGSGDMKDFHNNEERWGGKEIKYVEISDGITSIGSNAFADCSSIESVSIPDSIKTIRNGAFSGCYSLSSVTIPDSVESINDAAFYGCHSLRNIHLGNKIKTIDKQTFSDCIQLNDVTIPSSVKTISDGAFRECKSLKTITIPESVNTIGDWAFSGCRSIDSLTIPDSVTKIGNWAFNECSSITVLKIGKKLSTINSGLFCDCCSLKTVSMPDSVTKIDSFAFRGCRSLNSVDMPSVKIIGKEAFEGCESLKSISLPEGLTDIGDRAFNQCVLLKEVSLPSSIISIGKTAFPTNCSVNEYNKPKQRTKTKPSDSDHYCCICNGKTNNRVKDGYCCYNCMPTACKENPKRFTVSLIRYMAGLDSNIDESTIIDKSKDKNNDANGKKVENIETKANIQSDSTIHFCYVCGKESPCYKVKNGYCCESCLPSECRSNYQNYTIAEIRSLKDAKRKSGTIISKKITKQQKIGTDDNHHKGNNVTNVSQSFNESPNIKGMISSFNNRCRSISIVDRHNLSYEIVNLMNNNIPVSDLVGIIYTLVRTNNNLINNEAINDKLSTNYYKIMNEFYYEFVTKIESAIIKKNYSSKIDAYWRNTGHVKTFITTMKSFIDHIDYKKTSALRYNHLLKYAKKMGIKVFEEYSNIPLDA